MNNFQVKKFTLSVLFEFKKQQGYNYLSNNSSIYTPGLGLVNQPIVVLKRWRNPGDKVQVQKYTASYSSDAYFNMNVFLPSSNANITDASFIRCRNVSLSYDVQGALLRKLHTNKCTFYINCENLFVITKYKGSDPETQNMFVLPPMKTITGGFQLTF